MGGGRAPPARLLLVEHRQGSDRITYTYDGDGLKRSEKSGATTTTLVWDGGDYLQERS